MISNQRQQQIQHFVQTLSEDEIHTLYHQLGDQLHLARRARELYAMKDFHVLDAVSFDHSGRRIEGTVIRMNQRTISVLSTDGVRWNVSPQFLKKRDASTNGTGYSEGTSLKVGIVSGTHTSPLSNTRSSKNKRKKKKKRR